MAIGYDVLDLDLEAEAERICQAIRRGVSHDLKRRGVIVALSGGIDSSCVAALCARALGPKHVHGLHMPEKDSSDDTLGLSRSVSDTFGFDSTVEIITPIRVPSGSSTYAGSRPDTASFGIWSTGAPIASSAPRSGTYSPKGTIRTFS